MKASTKVSLGVLSCLFLLVLTIFILLNSHITTTKITIDNSTGLLLSDVKLDVAGKTTTDSEVGIFYTVIYRIKNQNEGSIKFSAVLEGEQISKEFGYVTHNMREEYLIYIRSAQDIRTYGQ